MRDVCVYKIGSASKIQKLSVCPSGTLVICGPVSWVTFESNCANNYIMVFAPQSPNSSSSGTPQNSDGIGVRSSGIARLSGLWGSAILPAGSRGIPRSVIYRQFADVKCFSMQVCYRVRPPSSHTPKTLLICANPMTQNGRAWLAHLWLCYWWGHCFQQKMHYLSSPLTYRQCVLLVHSVTFFMIFAVFDVWSLHMCAYTAVLYICHSSNTVDEAGY